MIIPWLKGFIDPRKSLMTWALIIFNFIVFISLTQSENIKLSRDILKTQDLILTGRLFYQFQNRQPEKPLLSSNDWMLLGAQAIRDKAFMEKGTNYSYYGDQIEIGRWKERITEYKKLNSERSSQIYGLQNRESSWRTFFTYQFMHASWVHLIGNMLMLFIFGTALELSIGGLAVFFIYILGGLFAAESFLLMSKASLAPMIGASGSLSAVMAFYAAFERKKRVSFFYMISPFKNYYGWIYLPTFLIIPICFLPDLVGYFSAPAELGTGVAYTAHIGGALFGAGLGFIAKYFWRQAPSFKSWIKLIARY